MSDRITCQCPHGVLDDEGESVSPCPAWAATSPEPCNADAEQRLVSTTNLNRSDGRVHLCKPCAEACLAEGEWVELATWEGRYLALVPEKLTAADAKALIELIEEDAQRFVEALEAFVALSEEVLG
jgi:hypothetical protein